jgi:hypothetical protein
MPPATVDETAWDILLALHSDQRGHLSLHRLASVISAPISIIDHWLAALEQGQLITGVEHALTGEIRPILTDAGRELLDNYLLATGALLATLTTKHFFDDPEKDPNARAH